MSPFHLVFIAEFCAYDVGVRLNVFEGFEEFEEFERFEGLRIPQSLSLLYCLISVNTDTIATLILYIYIFIFFIPVSNSYLPSL